MIQTFQVCNDRKSVMVLQTLTVLYNFEGGTVDKTTNTDLLAMLAILINIAVWEWVDSTFVFDSTLMFY